MSEKRRLFEPMNWRAQMMTMRQAPTDPAVLAQAVEHMAEAGLTHLVIEVEKGLHYASHPRVSADWAMSKQTLGEILRNARSHGIACVPLLPSLAHAAYLVAAYPEIAETDQGGVSCPRHPKTYEVVRDLTTELLDLFEPTLFHIGHDELLTSFRRDERRSVMQCPRCRGDNPAQWFLDDIRTWHDFLAQRGVGTMMWADMLMDPDSFRHVPTSYASVYGGPPDHFERAIEHLPRDIVLCDWHYAPLREYPSLRYIQDQGFDVLGCPNFHDSSFLFTHYAQCTRTPRLLGMMGTDWTPINEANAEQLFRKIKDNGTFFNGGDCPELRKKAEAAAARRFGFGDFEHVIDFSREGGGMLEISGISAFRAYEPASSFANSGLGLKPGRKGKVWVAFEGPPDGRFEQLVVELEGPLHGQGRVGLSVDHGRTYDFRPVAKRLDWSDVAAGHQRAVLQVEMCNDTPEFVDCLARITGRGRFAVVHRPATTAEPTA